MGYVKAYSRIEKIAEGEGFSFSYLNSPLKSRDDLAVNSSAIECLFVEVFNTNSSIVLNLTYRPPSSNPNELENHFKVYKSQYIALGMI